jgi:acetyl esterase/lipase
MLLAYPLAHFPVPRVEIPGLDAVPPMLRVPAEYQAAIVQTYVGRIDDLPEDVVPGSFAGLPEAWIAPAEYDDLRGSGELLARQLIEAGVPAHLELADGMVHGYLGRAPSLEPVSAVLDTFAAALRS